MRTPERARRGRMEAARKRARIRSK